MTYSDERLDKNVKLVNQRLPIGTMAMHLCGPGYSLNGVNSRTCQRDGTSMEGDPSNL